ncbi:hypothetical protein EJB05_34285, partial [Eragrostis curvula]
MVLLHVKSAANASSASPPVADGEDMEFLYECAASAAVADVAAALGDLAGLQARLLSLCRRLRERCADSSAAGELVRALDEAEAYASKNQYGDRAAPLPLQCKSPATASIREQVQHNRFLSPRALREHIKNIEKKCVTALQESPETFCLQQPSSDNKHGEIELWWAGKKLAIGQRLCDYVGVNDKTKIVIRLTRAPCEPGLFLSG